MTNTTKYGKNGSRSSQKAPVHAENAPRQPHVHQGSAQVIPENTPVQPPLHQESALVIPDVAPVQPNNVAQAENDVPSKLAEILGGGTSTFLNRFSPKKQARTTPKPRKKPANIPIGMRMLVKKVDSKEAEDNLRCHLLSEH
jgi:hypothetical protein